MLQNAAQTYQSNQVTTATPADLTLMLYNGALKFIKQAKVALEEKDVIKSHEASLKVQNILYELMSTLNSDYEISKEFAKLYEYMLQRTIEANMHKDVNILLEVEDLFIQFRDTWKEAMLLAKKQG
ncbi:flagellar export chaperone FliS [Brevibacillus formosus]|uniref:flagellar export chaperone FliS n=1 Tax=Brevibacillus TaxID=55080 RepID=UPI000D0F7123|nr:MULTISPECIES: flagellar export chaperone FliS [Brevibacillus]MBG9940488.1 flagellar biosynthesis protein FliS [Brevibacillus formosus]MED1944682.1 flagellar export chaperone FliS [Brevibacillus formosus]MED1996631.1 flagellar export chaperone FliS [Brevibacillus formosus]MED2081600.1 flagellar export chaperone FliS [Brevibacillus formosus]PSK12386.1 flagellar export chaperone FliS [Brevibacillus sp. NRRL NRS-603]